MRVALAAIANLLRHGIPEWLRAIDHIPGDRAQCDRVQTMRSSAHDLAATLIFAYKLNILYSFFIYVWKLLEAPSVA